MSKIEMIKKSCDKTGCSLVVCYEKYGKEPEKWYLLKCEKIIADFCSIRCLVEFLGNVEEIWKN